MHNVLEEVFYKKQKMGKKALMPFLPGGYPNKETFIKYIQEMDKFCDIIEIGVPFSDPVADGPVVEKASNIALENGINLEWIFDTLNDFKGKLQSKIVLMGYCNPFFKYGWENVAKDAKDAGVSGIIVADLPLEESNEIREMLNRYNVSLIYLVGLNTSKERMEKYSKVSSGFVYFVSVLGTTGVRDRLPEELVDKLREAREIFSTPIAIGFGIKSPEQINEIKGYVDGVVFGSSLINHIDNDKDIESFFHSWMSFV